VSVNLRTRTINNTFGREI